MSELIGIVGSSGEGKSTSIETLDPKSTFIINVIGKPLPFKGWKSRYIKADPANNTGNYVETDKSAEIVSILQYINDKRPEIKNIICEDLQYVMATESMNRALEKGYDKWSEIGKHMWDILQKARTMRSDARIFCLWHDETVSENYVPKRKIKTLGKILDSQVTLEGLFTIILFTKVTTDPKTKENTYEFVTQTEDGTTAKSPKEMFERYIPNDLAFVNKRIDEYYN